MVCARSNLSLCLRSIGGNTKWGTRKRYLVPTEHDFDRIVVASILDRNPQPRQYGYKKPRAVESHLVVPRVNRRLELGLLPPCLIEIVGMLGRCRVVGPIVLMYRLDNIVVDVELERVPCLQPVVLDGVDGLLLGVALLVGAEDACAASVYVVRGMV